MPPKYNHVEWATANKGWTAGRRTYVGATVVYVLPDSLVKTIETLKQEASSSGTPQDHALKCFQTVTDDGGQLVPQGEANAFATMVGQALLAIGGGEKKDGTFPSM